MRGQKWFKKIFYLSLVAMQIVALGPIHKAFSMGSNNKYTWTINNYYNTENLKAKTFKDPEFIKSWASIAYCLGFAWCGGTETNFVGDDFSFERRFENDNNGVAHEVYYLKANYNSSHEESKKYRANERLQMKISNIRLIIDPNTLKVETPRIIETKPITIASVVLENTSNKANKTRIDFIYESNKSWSKSNDFNFNSNEKIDIKRKFSVDIPLGENKGSKLSVDFGTGQGWKQSKEIAMTEMKSIKYYDKVQAKSKRQIDLIGMVQKSEVPYEGRIYIEYDMTLTGFLRGNGNGHVNHPTHRPTKSVTFGGRNGMSATEDLLDMYNNRDIKGYSEWDWKWIFDNLGYRYYMDYCLGNFCQTKYGGIIKGVFNLYEGTQIEIKAFDQEFINTMIKDEGYFKENNVEVKDFKYFKTPEFDVKGITINR